MENYKVLIKSSVEKELEALPQKDLKRIAKRIADLARQPRPHGCEKLSTQEKYRIRQGTYRVVYSIDDHEQIVVVVKVAHRRDVYRK